MNDEFDFEAELEKSIAHIVEEETSGAQAFVKNSEFGQAVKKTEQTERIVGNENEPESDSASPGRAKALSTRRKMLFPAPPTARAPRFGACWRPFFVEAPFFCRGRRASIRAGLPQRRLCAPRPSFRALLCRGVLPRFEACP